MSPLIRELRANPARAKEIIPSIFKEIDPDKKHQTKLLWLMVMPDNLIHQSFRFFEIAKEDMCEQTMTLGVLAKLYSSGTIFEDVTNDMSYQLVGFHSDGIAVRAFTSDMIEIMSPETIIRRIF